MPNKFSLEHGLRLCSSQCSRKKTPGLAVLLGVSSPDPDLSMGGWLTCLVWKPGEKGGETLSLWLEFHVRKQCKVREFFLRVRPAKSMRWLIIITLLAELTSHKLHGWGGWLVAPWTWLSRDSVQAPCMKSTQIYITSNNLRLRSVGDNERSKRFCSSAVLCVKFYVTDG